MTDTVEKPGQRAGWASTTRYYLSLDTKKTAGGVLLTGSRTAVGPLAARAVSSGTVTVTIPSTAANGTYFVLACADDLKKVTESNEKNSCRASATTVVVGP